MHILILPSWYPTPDNPINGCFFQEQAAALAAFGHKVTVMAVYGGSEDAVRTEKQTNGNLTEYRIYVRPMRFHLTYFRVIHAMMRLIRQDGKPDIIHVHSFYALRYARGLRALLHIPVVVTEHATWFERNLLSQKELRKIRRDYNACDAVIAVSPGLREHIKPCCTNKEILVVPNMVSNRFFGGKLIEKSYDSFGFISVGGMLYKKGFDILIKAFDIVHKKYPNTTLTVCGGEDKEQNYPELAEQYHFGDALCIRGRVSREECLHSMQMNQAFVLPSRAETFGVVYIEAMACGLPIIQTKIGAWTMLTTPETGVAVPVEDAEALADAMEHMIRNYADYDPETIRRYCREHFSEEAVCRRLTEVYEEVLNK